MYDGLLNELQNPTKLTCSSIVGKTTKKKKRISSEDIY